MGWMIVCIAALVAADQAVKWWAQTVLAALPGAHASFVPGVLSFEYVRNTGVAFSFFENGTVFFAVFTAVVLAAMLMILRRIYKRHIRLLNTALVLVIAGGLGNLIDRVARGYVVDMLNFEWISFPVFNVADVLICVGTGLLFVFILFFYEKYFPDKGKSKNNARMEDEDAGRT